MAVIRLGPGVDPPPVAEPIEDEMQLLHLNDVVKITKFSRTKVYRLVACGDIPSLRSGRSVRVPLMGLRRWIAQHSSAVSHASHVG